VIPPVEPLAAAGAGRVALQPAPDVVVIELLRPEKPGERLAHDVPRVVRQLLGDTVS
jgi:hypothetical protein